MGVQFVIGFVTAVLMASVFFIFLHKKWIKQKEMLIDKHNSFVHVVENTKDFIYYFEVEPEMKFKYLSPSAENFFGEGSNAKALAKPEAPFRDIHPDDYDKLMEKLSGEADYSKSIVQRWKDKDGTYRWFEEYATPIFKNGKFVAIQGVIRNIDDKVELQQELNYRIEHDALTGLYNREYFEQKFTEYNEQKNRPVGVIICDLDDFKKTNDQIGHKEGDILLKATANLLKKFQSNKVIVARLGGDEFVLFIVDQSENEIMLLVDSIRKSIKNNNQDIYNTKIKLSMGYAYTPTSIGTLTELFSKSDRNMYKDKLRRKKIYNQEVLV